MPVLSAFTPLGMLQLSGAPSHAERIYRSIVSGFRHQFDVTEGSRYEAWSYAEAMRLARIKYAAEHAAAQALPTTADVMIGEHESDFGIVPAWDATLAERRSELAVRWRNPRQPSRVEVEAALAELLGDDFIALVVTSAADASAWPADVHSSPSNLVPYSTVRRLVRFLAPVSFVSPTSVTVQYEVIGSTGQVDASGELLEGERLVVDADVPGLTERVEIDAVATSVDDDGNTTRSLTATFTKPHHSGCLAATGNFPAQTTTKRRSLVVMTPSAAVDAEKRRRVSDYMNRVARMTSTWDVVQGSGGTTGTFTIGESPIGAQTFGPVTY